MTNFLRATRLAVRALRRKTVRSALIAFIVVACTETPAVARPNATIVDRKAVEVLTMVEQNLGATPAYVWEGTTESYMPDGRLATRGRHVIRFLRPKRVRMESREARLRSDSTLGPEVLTIQAYDAERSYSWNGSDSTASSYRTRNQPYLEVKSIATAWEPGAELIFVREWNAKRVNDPTLIRLEHLGKRDWNGASYDVVRWVWREKWLAPEDSYLDTTDFYVAPDNTIRRIRTATSKGSVFEERTERLTLAASLTEADVAIGAGSGVKVVEYVDDTSAAGRRAKALIGSRAPAFEIPTALGDTVKLSAQLSGKRATVIYTWFYG